VATRRDLGGGPRGPVFPGGRRRAVREFYRGTASGSVPTGTGLGLTIAGEIARSHDGRLRVEDAKPHGARFVLTLPAGPLEGTRVNEGSPERALRVLVIDDEVQIRRALTSLLQARHYDVDVAATAEEGLERTASRTPDNHRAGSLAPGHGRARGDRSGCAEWYHGPIIILSVRNADDDKIAALDLGADDYLTKPFSTESCSPAYARSYDAPPARTPRSRDRRGGPAYRPWEAHRGRPERAVRLTRLDSTSSPCFARNAGRVVTSRMLLESVWGPEYVGDTQTLRVHVSHLRRKIELAGDVPRYVLTEPGVGFRFGGGE